MKFLKYCLLSLPLLLNPIFMQAQDGSASGVKVVSSKNPDLSSAETVLATIIKPDMKPQEKAEVLYKYMIERTYHHQTPEEPFASYLANKKYTGELAQIEDAIKLMNVYGFGLCGSHSKYQNLFFNAMGMLGRINGANGHTVPEVKYDGKWHYFDLDMMGYVKTADGNILSHDEVGSNIKFLKENTSEYKFKFDGPNNMFGCLSGGVKFSMYGRKMGIHSMNLPLRKGEKITRYFQRQWAPNFHYYTAPTTLSNEYPKRMAQNLKNNSPGPSRDKSFYMFKEQGAARFGNWETIYEPNLADPDFITDLFASTNVKQNKSAPFVVTAKNDAPAELILNYYSAYGCAGIPGDLSTLEDDRDGFVLAGEFNNDSGEISYSLDTGRNWIEAHKGGGKFELDLTPKLGAQYSWMIKVTFNGKDAGLKAYKSVTKGQLSPASLPYVDGETEMTFSRDNTACLLYAPDISISEEAFKSQAYKLDNYLNYAENITQLVGFGSNNNGGVIYKVDVPNDIVFVKAGANFSCRRDTTRNGVAFSLDNGETWITACEQGVISNEDHNEEFWGQGVEGVLDFRTGKAYSPGATPVEGTIREGTFTPKAVKSILVKFYTKEGNGRLSKVAGIYVHYKKEQKNPIVVTHTWQGGEHVEKIPAGEQKHAYKVAGGSLDKNLSVTIEVPAK